MPILDWLNKRQALQAAAAVPYRLIEVDAVHGDPAADNWLIQGDNLDALKALLPFHAGRVKCIYIDPPYNTRSAFEHYDDNLEHSQWLSMMAPRLELLRELLAEDGSIWVSIDDNEGHYLKVLMDEVFGRGNFVTTIAWQQRTTRENRKVFSANHEYLHVFAKDYAKFAAARNDLPLTEEVRARYKNPDEDPRGAWQSVSANAQAGHATPSQFYDLVAPNGKLHRLPQGRCWLYTRERMEEEIAKGNIWFGNSGNGVPRVKKFLVDVSAGLTPDTLWPATDVGTNDLAKKHLKALFADGELFDTPKPESLIKRIFDIATNPGDLVLDSFLGSGTTAAVAHKMGRRYIGIEMGEHAHTHCLPRLQKVIAGEQGGISKAVDWQGGGGVRFARLGASVFLPDGQVDPQIGFATLAAWIWYQETRTPWRPQTADAQPASPLLGVHEGRAYFLLFNGVLGDRRPQGGNVLTSAVAALLDEAAAGAGVAAGMPRVVFGEACRLSELRRRALGIDFRQIPYDIRARQEAPAWR